MSRTAVCFDLETIPNLDMVKLLPEPEVATGNMKDVAKIEAKKEEAKRKQIDTMALSPFTARVCAYSTFDGKDGNEDVIKEITDVEEKRIVECALAILSLDDPKNDYLVGFNSMSFDVPMLYGRSMMFGLRPPIYPLGFWTKRYSYQPHFDVRMILTNWEYAAKGDLNFFSSLILGESKKDLDYKEFINMIKGGKGAEIAKMCTQHNHITYKLYEKSRPYYCN